VSAASRKSFGHDLIASIQEPSQVLICARTAVKPINDVGALSVT
jgi:hypothetical protein